jgi:flavin-dependent dehydrogenase
MLADAAKQAGASLHTGAYLARCEQPSEKPWQIEIHKGKTRRSFEARVLVDATGRVAVLARKLGARKINYDRLVGVVGFYRRQQQPRPAPAHYTLVESIDDGWWYSASLPDGRLVAAYMTDADLRPPGSRISFDYLQKQIAHGIHTASNLHGYALESGPIISAANSARTDLIAGRNWLAVGDAAAAFDPLSSQGVLVALKSGLQAARAIEDHLSGNSASLQDYAMWVKKGFEKHLTIRDRFYKREQRWPTSVFWHRRQAQPPGI